MKKHYKTKKADMVMEIYLVYVLLALLLFWGVSFAKKGEFHADYLSLKSAKCIEGFAAIGVIIHHLSQIFTNFAQIKSPLVPFNDIGAFFVGLFFFFSGYGLIKNLRTKENYLKGFLWKRLVTVLVLFFFINLIYITVRVIWGMRCSVWEYVSLFLGFRLVNGDAWYVIAIVILYIVFYLLFRFVKKEWIAFAGMAVFIAGYVAFCIFSGHGDGTRLLQGEWWCNTVPVFFLGLVWARFEGEIFGFAKKTYAVLLPVFSFATLAMWYVMFYVLNSGHVGYWSEGPGNPAFEEKWVCLIIQSTATLFFVITCMLINMKVKFSNKVLSFLGGLTLSIYLIQRLFINYFVGMIPNQFLTVIVVVAVVVLAAFLVNLVCTQIKKLLLPKKKAEAVQTKQ